MRIFVFVFSLFISSEAVIPNLFQARLDWPYTDGEIEEHLAGWKKISTEDENRTEIVSPALNRKPRYTTWHTLVSKKRDRNNFNRMLRMLRGY